ncbi:hypothetical protein CCYA_CCYA02G0572 [Cyanidiococcus yangmingshanensis]|nr:hypothetical protein CCYA_CCYA02G0572 [Cyanidiococcus yangmingshanensis]
MSLSVVAQQVRIETGGLNSSNSRLALDVSVSEEDISRTVVDTPSVTGHGLRHEPAGRYSDQATLAGQSLCPAEQHEENDFTNRSVVSASSGVEMISAQVGRPEQRLTTEDLKHILRDRCERCGAEHDRSFGSGRFCSVQCARRVAAKAKWARYHDRKRRGHSAEQIGVQAEGASTPPVYEPAHRKRIRPNGEMQCSLASWEMNGTRGLQAPLRECPPIVLTSGNPPLTQLQNGSILIGRSAAEFCLPRERHARWPWRFPHGYHRMELLTAPVCQRQVSDETLKRNSVALPPFSVAFGESHGLIWSQPPGRISRPHNKKQSLPSFIEVSRFAKSVSSTWSVLRNNLTDPLRYWH